jgi:hypothetical protein
MIEKYPPTTSEPAMADIDDLKAEIKKLNARPRRPRWTCTT